MHWLAFIVRDWGVNSVSYIMGQPLQDTIESGVVIGDVPMEQLLDAVEAHVANGCKRIKLKVNPTDGYAGRP